MVTLRLRPRIIKVFLKMFPLIKGFLSNLDQVHLTLGEIYHFIQLLVIVEALSQSWEDCLFSRRTADPIGAFKNFSVIQPLPRGGSSFKGLGIEGFEPPTSSSQMRRSTKLSHIPKSSLRRMSYWNTFTIDLTGAIGHPTGERSRICSLKGCCPSQLDDGALL